MAEHRADILPQRKVIPGAGPGHSEATAVQEKEIVTLTARNLFWASSILPPDIRRVIEGLIVMGQQKVNMAVVRLLK